MLLEAGEAIKALVECRGHSDPGFTLRRNTRLMPNSQDRARKTIDAAFRTEAEADGDAGTAPAAAGTAPTEKAVGRAFRERKNTADGPEAAQVSGAPL